MKNALKFQLDYNNFGCDGGYPGMVFSYVAKLGIATEKVYPYIDSTPKQ